jgi:hypothetical protein
MAMLMRKRILLINYDCPRQAFDDDPYTCNFFFSIVDSSLVRHPRQKSATTYHVVTVTITWETLVNWGLDPNNNPDKNKLLFWYAKERIEENVKSGNLPAKDELTVTAQTTKDKCLFDISVIPDPRGYTFDVDVDVDKIHSHNEVSIDDIESFAKARDIDPQEVKPLLPLNLAEDQIQIFFEEIIGENFHQDDWGGEMNDLVTSHLRIGGRRLRVAFLLKGSGTRGKLTIGKCGGNGDQILRLTEATVDLYAIQHVDEIDQRVIYDLRGKVDLKNERGDHCKLCIIDGTDTARILRAYGKI